MPNGRRTARYLELDQTKVITKGVGDRLKSMDKTLEAAQTQVTMAGDGSNFVLRM